MDAETQSAFNLLKVQNDIYLALGKFAHQLEQSLEVKIFGPTFSWHNFEYPSVQGLKGGFQVDVVAELNSGAKSWTLTIFCYEDKWIIESLVTVLTVGAGQTGDEEDDTEAYELPQHAAHNLKDLAEQANQAVTELTQSG